ncbi:NAD-dependent epimerase/dehydratase family protein [bacterium]|nr:NAD-dependent epimerase/dehydratase family protein [bacterium]MBU1637956.1 NAD-dependent epimerase/dehydratase family protein [bacterium]
MKRVLITGGTGFVGSHAVEAYLNAGWTVRAFIRDPNRLVWLSNLNIETAVGKLSDRDSLKRAAEACDTVVHCAGLTKALHKEEFFRVNGDAVRDFAEAAREQGVRRFILCSSQAAAGPSCSEQPRTEADEPAPVSVYGQSKLAGESVLQEAAGDMEWVILRPPAIIGPRDWQFLPLFKGIIKLGLYPKFGSGRQLYSFASVFDVVKALLMAGTYEGPVNQLYFVAHDEPVDWQIASQEIAGYVNRRVRNLTLPAGLLDMIGTFNDAVASVSGKPALLSREKVKEILVSGWVCSNEKIKRDWKFECDYDLRKTLRITYDFYKSCGKL